MSFEDGVYGLQERDYADTEDLVLLRSDGHPLYNLAVVCDDIEMQITHVIRGQDHLTNTHKQLLIYEALGAQPPTFAHLPLIMAPNKGKLSKRKHGEVVSMTTYRDAGFLAAAFRNFLALLGWSRARWRSIRWRLIEKFSLDGIHRSNAVFNFHPDDPRKWTDDKAIWMNAEYIRTMPLADLLPLVKAELKANKLWRDEYEESAGSPPYEGGVAAAAADGVVLSSRAWYERTVDLIRARFFTLKDFSSQGRAYFSEDFDFDPAAVAKNLTKFPDLKTWLPELADRFETDFNTLSPHHSRGLLLCEGILKRSSKLHRGKGHQARRHNERHHAASPGVAVGPSMLWFFDDILEKNLRLQSNRMNT
jgi:glutamyl-tRNA synthetase